MFYGARSDAEFEEGFLDGIGALGGMGAMGPKQRKCVKAGGQWVGPKGKMYCVMPGTVIGTAVSEVAKATPRQIRAYKACVAKQAKGARILCKAPPGVTPVTHETQQRAPSTRGMGPRQKKCVKGGGQWLGPTGKKACVMPGEVVSILPPIEQTPVVTAPPSTKGMGPRQKKCVKGGGQWLGPRGKRYCVMPGQVITPDTPVEQPPQQQLVAPIAQALPKKGSFYSGPEPTPPAGGWPAFSGGAGPKQKKCTKQGGRWIGPTGRKWCQLLAAVITPDLPVEQPDVPQWLSEPDEFYQRGCERTGGVWKNGACVSPSTPQPAACGTGYVRKGADCYPVAQAPGPGYELKRYESTQYFQYVYTGVGVVQPQPQDPNTYLREDWGTPQPQPQPQPLPYPAPGPGQSGGWETLPPGFDYGGVDGGAYIDPGAAPPPMPPPLLMPIDEGMPVEMSAGATAGARECDPGFASLLPMEYSDQYGSMMVLQIVCPNSVGTAGSAGGFDIGAQGPVEDAEIAAMMDGG